MDGPDLPAPEGMILGIAAETRPVDGLLCCGLFAPIFS
jgi:hypothetical protein